MKNALVLAALAALVGGVLAAVWLADWRWLATGASAFIGLGIASGLAPGDVRR